MRKSTNLRADFLTICVQCSSILDIVNCVAVIGSPPIWIQFLMGTLRVAFYIITMYLLVTLQVLYSSHKVPNKKKYVSVVARIPVYVLFLLCLDSVPGGQMWRLMNFQHVKFLLLFFRRGCSPQFWLEVRIGLIKNIKKWCCYILNIIYVCIWKSMYVCKYFMRSHTAYPIAIKICQLIAYIYEKNIGYILKQQWWAYYCSQFCDDIIFIMYNINLF